MCLCMRVFVCLCNWSADSQLEFKYIDSQGDKISFIGLLALNLATHYYINRGLHISMYMHIYACMYVVYMYGIYMVYIIESYIVVCVCLYIVYLLYSKKKVSH